MKSAYVVVEGAADAEILRAVIDPELLSDVEIVPAGGVAYVPSLARSLLVRRRVPVAIFVDSHSLDKGVITDRRTEFKGLLNAVAGRDSTEVVLAIPEMEAIFFHCASRDQKSVRSSFSGAKELCQNKLPKLVLRS